VVHRAFLIIDSSDYAGQLVESNQYDSAFSHQAGNAPVLTFALTFLTMRILRKQMKSRVFHTFRAGICGFGWFFGALAWCLLAASGVYAQEGAIEGVRVAALTIVDSNGQEIKSGGPALPLEINKPFDYSAERESIRALYRTGNFADIQVRADNLPDGLSIRFIVTRNFYNNVVRIDGLKAPPTEAAALASMRLSLGEPFRESALGAAIDRLKDTLRAEGFFQADVKFITTPHQDTRQMDVLVIVTTGVRASIGSFVFKNHTPFPDTELATRSGIKIQNSLTSARITRASQKLKKYLVNQGYLGAGILITPGAYDAKTNTVPVEYNVTTGSKVSVTLSGARLSKGKLRQLLPIYAEGAVDQDLLQEGRRNIRDYFQRQGYFDADVQVNSRDDPATGQRVIAYEIARGDKFRLAAITFNGNKYFGKDLLEGRLSLQTASFASSGRYSQSFLRDDGESIRGLYLSNGFLDAKVTSTVDDNYQGKKNNLHVSFEIAEGAQTRVETLAIEGNHFLSMDALFAVVGSSPGQPYSAAGVASDRNNILAIYYNDGFPEAHLDEKISPGSKAEEVRVTYQITEGEQIEVAKVLLTGYQFTRPGVIARQVTIKPEGPLREGDLVETQRRLYNLGVFTRVQIAPQNPGGNDPEKTMVVEVQEGGRYTFGYGFGFEVLNIATNCPINPPPPPPGKMACNPNGTQLAASPRGIIELSRANMFGRAQTLSFKARASTLQYRSLVSYSADDFFGNRKLSAALTGFADKTQDVQTFTSIRYEGQFQISQKLTPSSSILYRYFFRRVVASQLRVAQDEVPLFNQPTLVSGFGITYARDRRDNPGDPKRGNFNTVDVSLASRALGSSASFVRTFFQNSSYYSFGRNFVFARAVRFGMENPLGQTVEGTPPVCNSTVVTDQIIVPLPERFFAGGGQSLRGFSLNQAGPRDPCTGFPIGGLALLVFNQELHFPMKLPFVGNRLGGTIFYDGGNVYQDVSHINFAWKSSSATELNYFSHTIGFGLRYPTPIGPVRVDIGYQLNPALYQVVPVGTTVPEFFRVSHFGFSFNIGPVF
jgi:outer membrane protein insertion porin family